MPYFSWRGVDIEGSYHKGSMYAKNAHFLDNRLFQQHIALISYKKTLSFPFFTKKIISIQQKIELFEQLSLLLRAGVLLPDALALVADQLSGVYIQDRIHTVADAVREGIALSDALSQKTRCFDSITLYLIKAGEESGMLSDALESLAGHYTRVELFIRQVRRALFMPAITLFFFSVIAAVVLVGIIPRFAQLFTSLSKPIPLYTQKLLWLGDFLTSAYMIVVISALIGIIYLLRIYCKTSTGRVVIAFLFDYVPWINSINRYYLTQRVCESLGLLLKGGIQIVPALQILASTQSIGISKIAYTLKESIVCGIPLHLAMEKLYIFSAQTKALVLVGQESGTLPTMLLRIASIQEQLLQKRMMTISQLIQPVVLIIIGAFIALLIGSVYGPLLNLASVV